MNMKRKIIKRKSLSFRILIKIILAVIFWLGFLYILFFIDPDIWKSIYYLPFVSVFIFAIGLSISIFLKKIIITIIISLGVGIILILRIFGFKDYLNPILIIGLVITLIYFFTVNDESDKLKNKTLIKQSDKK